MKNFQGLELVTSNDKVSITGWYRYHCHQEGKYRKCATPDKSEKTLLKKGTRASHTGYCDHHVMWKLELRYFGKLNDLHYFLNLINFDIQDAVKQVYNRIVNATVKRNTIPAPYLITGQTIKVTDWYQYFNHADSQYNVPGDHGDCNGLDYHELIRMLFKKGDIVPGIMSCDHIVKWKLWR